MTAKIRFFIRGRRGGGVGIELGSRRLGARAVAIAALMPLQFMGRNPA
jgi:hypothetical protein